MTSLLTDLLSASLTGANAKAKKSKKSKGSPSPTPDAETTTASAQPNTTSSPVNHLDTSSQAVQPSDQTRKEVAAAVESRGQKGVVEEVISKRLKALSKKITRIKTYSSQPAESLNADQKATLTTLPALEAVAKELDELIKPGGPVETAELAQSSILREARDSAEARVHTVSAQKVVDFQNSLSTPLGRFLRLHTLLHPARPSDHTHITSGELDLPSTLRSEVKASDVLRVGRMYEDLLKGGEDGAKVIAVLVPGGAAEVDAEDAHIHHLLQLLDQSAVNVNSPREAEEATTRHGADGVIAPDSVEEPKQEVDYGTMNGDARDDELSFGAEAIREEFTTQGNNGIGALNFLQEDELVNEPTVPGGVTFPNGYPTPTSLPPAPEPSQHDSAVTREPAQTVPALSAFDSGAHQKLDWTLDEDEQDQQHFQQQQQAAPQVEVVEPTGDSSNIEEERKLVSEGGLEQQPGQEGQSASQPIADVDASTPNETPAPVADEATAITSTSGQTDPKAGFENGKVPNGPRRGRGMGRPPQNRQHQHRPPQHGQGATADAVTSVDADGFEQVGKRQGPPMRGGMGRGRGFGGERGRGVGGRGRGQGQGQGRGGHPRNAGPGPNGANGGMESGQPPLLEPPVSARPHGEERKQGQGAGNSEGQGQRQHHQHNGGSQRGRGGPRPNGGQGRPPMTSQGSEKKGSIYKSVTPSGVPAAAAPAQ